MDNLNLKKKILDLAPRFRKEVLDNYMEFPVSSGERRLIEELSKIFLYEELTFDTKNKESIDLEKEAMPYIEKMGSGSAFLARLMISYINQELKNSSFIIEEIKRKLAEYKEKIDKAKSNMVVTKSPEEFLKEYFQNPQETDREHVSHYKNLYQYYYYFALTKFVTYIKYDT